MKVVVINGSTASDGLTNQTFDAIITEFLNRKTEMDTYVLRDMKIGHCAGCFGCWTRTPGICQMDDDAKLIISSAVNSDLLVMVTPVVFGCYSPLMKNAAERLTPILSPFFEKTNGQVHHKKRYDNYPSLLAIGVMDQPDDESRRIFTDLVRRNAVNLHSPGWTAGIIGKSDLQTLNAQIAELLDQMEVAK